MLLKWNIENIKYLASKYCTEHSNVEGHDLLNQYALIKQSTKVLYKMDIRDIR